VDGLLSFDQSALSDEATLIVDVVDDLDMQGASVLEFPLDGTRMVVGNARDVTFLDSAGLGAIVELYHRVGRHGAVLRLVVNPDSMVRRVLQITQIDELIPFSSDRDEAVRDQ
jgi:anti-anti-sigma factor